MVAKGIWTVIRLCETEHNEKKYGAFGKIELECKEGAAGMQQVKPGIWFASLQHGGMMSKWLQADHH